MGVDGMRRFVVGGGTGVPNHQLLVIGHGTEQGFVKQMPGHVFHDGGMTSENCFGIDHLRNQVFFKLVQKLTIDIVNYLVIFGSGINVPQANGVVVGSRQQMTIQVGIPGQTISFLLVTSQSEIRVTNSGRIGL